jgi:hypothetical protein
VRQISPATDVGLFVKFAPIGLQFLVGNLYGKMRERIGKVQKKGFCLLLLINFSASAVIKSPE